MAAGDGERLSRPGCSDLTRVLLQNIATQKGWKCCDFEPVSAGMGKGDPSDRAVSLGRGSGAPTEHG